MSPAAAAVELSVVLPVFNEEAVVPELLRRLRPTFDGLGVSWEAIFVDDGSTDKTFALLQAASLEDERLKLLRFSRNFGHQIAITAGMDYAQGDAVVIMDADLQDPPEVVAEMLQQFRNGFDVVYAVRNRRAGESLFKRATASVFYRLLKVMAGVDIPVDAGDFRLMSRRVVLTLRGLRETNRFVRGLVAWVGFRQTAVHYDRTARFAGETHYPLRKMLRFASDGIVSFSPVPLRLATYLGVLAGVLAAGVAAWVVYSKLSGSPTVPGWATVMLAVSLGSCAQLLMIGILGQYLGRIYDEVKRRPLYLLEDKANFREAEPRSERRSS